MVLRSVVLRWCEYICLHFDFLDSVSPKTGSRRTATLTYFVAFSKKKSPRKDLHLQLSGYNQICYSLHHREF